MPSVVSSVVSSTMSSAVSSVISSVSTRMSSGRLSVGVSSRKKGKHEENLFQKGWLVLFRFGFKKRTRCWKFMARLTLVNEYFELSGLFYIREMMINDVMNQESFVITLMGNKRRP